MPSITLAVLQQNVLDRLENNSALFTTQEITNAINEFYRISNIFIGINQATVSVPGFSVANSYLYSVPSPILFPMFVSFEGRQLRKMSLPSLARNFPQWAYETSAKLGRVQRWAPIGITQFVIHPMDSIGGRDISVTGVTEPSLLVNPGDVISLEDEFVNLCIEYSGHRVQLKEGGKVFADASLLLQRYYQILKQRMQFQQLKFPRYFIAKGAAE